MNSPDASFHDLVVEIVRKLGGQRNAEIALPPLSNVFKDLLPKPVDARCSMEFVDAEKLRDAGGVRGATGVIRFISLRQCACSHRACDFRGIAVPIAGRRLPGQHEHERRLPA